MKILRQADPRVRALLGVPETRAEGLRLSRFVLSGVAGGQAYMANTLTRQLVLLDGDEARTLRRLRDGESDRAGGELAAWLRREGWLVPSDRDETAFYLQLLSLLRYVFPSKPGFKRFTILPTTACNARCVYCFEEGFRSVTMTDDTADAVADFIISSGRDGRISLLWFGGEPLAAHPVITRICGRLRTAGVDYVSDLISNGTLLTAPLADEAVNGWRLQSCQISVDGRKDDYLARKNFPDRSVDHYERMMEAIGLLLARGVRVMVRINCDGENLDGITEYAADLRRRFGTPPLLFLHLHTIFQLQDSERSVAMQEALRRRSDELRSMGFQVPGSRFKPNLKLYYCDAEKPSRTAVIDPEGLLYSCENIACQKPWGDVRNGMTDPEQWAYLTREMPLREMCRDCALLPSCTPYPDCPNRTVNCRDVNRIQIEDSIACLIANPPSDGADEEPEERNDPC